MTQGEILQIARDKDGQAMWVKGHTNISILTYREWMEARGMESGSVTKDGVTFHPPFTLRDEEAFDANPDDLTDVMIGVVDRQIEERELHKNHVIFTKK